MLDMKLQSAHMRWMGAEKDDRVCREVPPIETSELQSAILFGVEGSVPNTGILRTHLAREGRLAKQCALELVRRTAALLRRLPNVVPLSPPLLLIGDLHGQFYDLLNLFDQAGQPAEGRRYLFLGDYVDRGMFGCETVFYLFALKLAFPEQVTLLRGNHESREITEFFNFEQEAFVKYDEEVYVAIMDAFDALPLAALVDTPSYGRYLCLHGGIGPSLTSLADIDTVNRFQEPPESGPFCDLLWSDPIDKEEYPQMTDEAFDTFDFLSNDARGVGWIFGKTALRRFLDANGLTCLVRAHEVQQHGYAEHRFGDRERAAPYCVTVFSAPNYCDMYENRGGIMEFGADGYQFHQTAWVSHPYWLPDFMNAFSFSLPYVADNTKNIVFNLLMSMLECAATDDEGDDDDAPVWASIQAKLAAARDCIPAQDSIRNQRVAMVLPKLKFGGENTFKQARALDKQNEKRPPRKHIPGMLRRAKSARW